MPETQKKQFLLLFSTFLTTLLTLSLLFFTNAIAWAGDVPLAWDPSPDNVDGYTIHYGPESGNYSSSDKVGNKTSHTVSGLAAGKYYFAVSAYKGSVESGYSNEVNTTIPDATGTSSGGNTGSGGSGGTSTTDGVYQQDSGAQGLLVMESEHFAGNVPQGGHNWVPVTDPAGFSGSGAMRASPVSGARIDTNYVANSPRLDFKVNFAKSGTHYVWLRGLSTSSADNSAHVGLDGQANTTADRIDFNSTSNWDWTNNTMDSIRATVNVATPGEHTVNVWMREDGLRLDRVVLATDANFVPSGTGPTESASQTGVQEAPVAEAPVARFSASPTSGEVPLIVTFSDASTGDIDTWSWDFGDGRTSTAQTAAYNIKLLEPSRLS